MFFLTTIFVKKSNISVTQHISDVDNWRVRSSFINRQTFTQWSQLINLSLMLIKRSQMGMLFDLRDPLRMENQKRKINFQNIQYFIHKQEFPISTKATQQRIIFFYDFRMFSHMCNVNIFQARENKEGNVWCKLFYGKIIFRKGY